MVKQVDSETIAEVLRIRHAVDSVGAPAHIDEGETHPWVALLQGFAHQDVIDSVWMHYTRESRAVWPADVIRRLEDVAVERHQDALQHKELAQQDQAEWSEEDKAAWSVGWDEAIGRGERVAQAKDQADKARSRTR
jgi:hypothetical protein